MGGGKLVDIIAGIRFFYENKYNLLKEVPELREEDTEHEADGLDPELTEKLCKAVEFAKSPAGEALEETVRKLDQAIIEHDKHQTDILFAKWEVFKLMIVQLTGLEFHFTRIDEYFGLCTEDERIYMMKVERGGVTDGG